jgi:asparagine synthase (glutamine-hydrolysing)
MCGITAIVSTETISNLSNVLFKMNDSITHRGPDGFGYYYGPNFAFGHRRLAILDLSAAGKQPMEYLNKYVIVYNGEIYNYVELKNELEKDGHKFRSHTDTEVILASYDRWGIDCVSHFNGMWAFVLFDKIKNILFCSRDRFGIKPFYFVKIGNRFVCASEIKQFTCLEGWEARLNRRTAFDFLEYGIFDHTYETLFDGVFQLRGGHSLIYDLKNHTYDIKKWYDLEKAAKERQIDIEAAASMFQDLMTDSIKLRLRSDVKVGSCLSGGLDSSTIVCIANDLLRRQGAHDKQETVSSCFNEKRFDEQEYIDEVIKKTNAVSHRTYPQFGELIRNIDKMIWHQDEPFGSTSIFAQWEVFRTAKEKGIIVMLDGQGADELLAGYTPFFEPFFGNFIRTRHFREFLFELKSFKNLHKHSNLHVANTLLKALIPMRLLRYKHLIFRKKTPNWLNTHNLPRNDNVITKKRVNIRDFSLTQIIHTSLPMLLHYEDRNSMAHSIESRVPFLDYRLVEFIVGLPDNQKIRDGKTKFILRQAMKGTIPERIRNRYDKMGFVTPEITWLREQRLWFESELKNSIDSSKGIINNNILKYFHNITSEGTITDFVIWRALAFGRWINVYNVSI